MYHSKFIQNTENMEENQTTTFTIDPNNSEQFFQILKTEQRVISIALK